MTVRIQAAKTKEKRELAHGWFLLGVHWTLQFLMGIGAPIDQGKAEMILSKADRDGPDGHFFYIRA